MIENNVMIFGITGQDGSYLAVHLSKLGYNVIGVRRSTSTDNLSNLRRVQVLESFDCLLNKIKLEHGDVTDPISVSTLISRYKPYKIFNLAAQSHVGISFETPLLTANVDGIGTLNILEAIKMHSPKSRFYQASTSELFGGQSKMKLDENSLYINNINEEVDNSVDLNAYGFIESILLLIITISLLVFLLRNHR